MSTRITAPTTSRRTRSTGTEDFGALVEVIARLRRVMRRAARAMDPAGSLSVAQLEVLSYLLDHPGARSGEVARHLQLAPNSATTLVTSLTALGLITRSGASSDRRAISLSVTDAGHAAVVQWQEVNALILRTALGSLDPGWQHLLGAVVPAFNELVHAIEGLTADSIEDRRR